MNDDDARWFAEASAAVNIDGPHSPEKTRKAADLADELVRFLNHATGFHRADGLEWGADAYKVTGSMSSLVSRLPQLLEQLGEWLQAEAAAGRLRIADGDYVGDPAGAVDKVRDWYAEAMVFAGGLSGSLAAAHRVTSAIGGYDTPDRLPPGGDEH